MRSSCACTFPTATRPADGRSARGRRWLRQRTSLYVGDRIGRVRDPLGNIWWLQAHIADVDPADLAGGPRDQAEAEALRKVRDHWTR